jgi:hypothetical protein
VNKVIMRRPSIPKREKGARKVGRLDAEASDICEPRRPRQNRHQARQQDFMQPFIQRAGDFPGLPRVR